MSKQPVAIKKQESEAKQQEQLPARVTGASNTATIAATESQAFEEYAGEGLENVTAKDVLIPRITIIQSTSDQIKRNKAEYIEGSTPGQFIDVSTNEIIPEPFYVIPVYFVKQWLEWFPRGSPKGKLANIHIDERVMNNCVPNPDNDPKKRGLLPNGNVVIETQQFYVLNMSMGGRRAFIPFSSTQIKKGKLWLTLATGERIPRADGSLFIPPLFYRCYRMETVPENNTAGDWMGWKIERGPALPEKEFFEMFGKHKPILDEAKQFRDELSAGTIRGDIESMKDEVEKDTGTRPDERVYNTEDTRI